MANGLHTRDPQDWQPCCYIVDDLWGVAAVKGHRAYDRFGGAYGLGDADTQLFYEGVDMDSQFFRALGQYHHNQYDNRKAASARTARPAS